MAMATPSNGSRGRRRILHPAPIMVEDTFEDICIDKPHCRLCQFQLQDGESVVALLEDDRTSSPFCFLRNAIYEDSTVRAAFHMCGRSRCMTRRRVPCLHNSCYSSRLRPISPAFLAATDHDFSPPLRSELQRHDRIKYAAASGLKRGLLRRMPFELCEMVAEYLTREFAAIAYEALARDARPENATVDLARDVYATYVNIDSVSYLQALHNSPHEGDAGERIHDARQGHVVRKIYIAYDYLGIRSVHFSLPNSDFLPSSHGGSRGVWWTELARSGGLVEVTTQYDGLKVRRLVDSTDSLPAGNEAVLGPGWPTPGLSCRVIDLDTGEIARPPPSNLRMSSFDCNISGINGYSAAIYAFHVAKLHAHYSDTSADFYSDLGDMSKFALWLYMPMNSGEYLAEIWVVIQSGFMVHSGFVAFLFCTNRQRAVMFGTYTKPHSSWVELQFHRVYATTDHPSRIYFNDWDILYGDKWIKYLGVENPPAQPTTPVEGWTPYPPSLTPSMPPPNTASSEPWYYTNCRLEGVVEITCCVDPTVSHVPIIGMLVRYGNGDRACVGQYRVDWAGDARKTAVPSEMLRIGMGKTRGNFPYVARVDVRALVTEDADKLVWLDVPWRGRLEWWFSQRQCRLLYSEEESGEPGQ